MVTWQDRAAFPPQELERRILRGLSWEWESALWVLDRRSREAMRPPLFRLADLNGRWGTWSGDRREITLSRTLVLEHPWDAIVEVLLHEMAHQFAGEVLGAREETPHGPLFKKACFLLRANPRASGNYPTLDERISRHAPSTRDKLTRRVKKLLALAESPNPHEAEAAMAKVHDLIARYNLDLLAREERRDFVSAFAGTPALRHFPEDYALAHLLTDFYFVQGIWVSAFVPQRGKMGRVLEISGTLPNLQMAGYVHDFVRQFNESQWKDYKGWRRLNRRRRTDFTLGILEGLRTKLETNRHRPQEGKTGRALMKIEDPLLREYMSYRYPRTAKIRRGASSRNRQVWQDGKNIGQKLVISKGITTSTGSRGLLIREGIKIPSPKKCAAAGTLIS